MRRLLVVIAVTLLVPAARGQSCHDASAEGSVAWVPVELLQRPVELHEGVGKVHERVTTQSAEAQAFYDQGLAYLHSYVWIEAARSFHQALRHDPKLAMAYVGLSRAYAGMYDLDAAARMSEAAAKLADGVSARERAHIELRALRVASAAAPKDLEKLAAYRARLDRELSRHYDDLELWLLRGNIEDRVGAMGIGQYGNVSSIPFYEHVLSVDPEHFGAHHFLIHSFEGANRIDDALKHGAKYAAAAV
ncbi:MAG TPA: hypothetical protein VHL59_04745, partial [Thermoanaerobaculia bacterium]|nr:hypothetical protein [Thermoanaerobaculia bacterium]